MPAKPNVCVVLQCRQKTFKGEGAKYLKKGLLLLSLLLLQLLLFSYYIAVAIIAVAVFKSGTSVSIFQRRSGYYLLYGTIETHRSHESVYNSFLDAQIKETEYSFNLKSSGSTMPVRPDINNFLQAMSIIKIVHVRYWH